MAARKDPQMASIALNQTGVSLGDTVTFTVDGIPKKVKHPRVEVLAYQSTCAPGYTCDTDDQTPAGDVRTYGEAGEPTDNFTLGGGASAWLAQGGPATCVANLFYFDTSGPTTTYVRLATCEFNAAG